MRIIRMLRGELEEVNKRILSAPSITNPNLNVLRRFVLNQLYIVPHDLRALSTFMVKARDEVELRFVKMLVDGDYFQFHAPDSVGVRAFLTSFRPAMYSMSFL
jgi:hypothetical protein